MRGRESYASGSTLQHTALRSGNFYWTKAMLAADNLAAPVEPYKRLFRVKTHHTK